MSLTKVGGAILWFLRSQNLLVRVSAFQGPQLLKSTGAEGKNHKVWEVFPGENTGTAKFGPESFGAALTRGRKLNV